jgi:hypothetical protein
MDRARAGADGASFLNLPIHFARCCIIDTLSAYPVRPSLVSTRVLLIDMTRVLREIARVIFTREPAIDVVGELPDTRELLPTVQRTWPDVLVVGLDDHRLPAAYGSVFRMLPAARVIAVYGDGQYADLYELRLHREPLGRASWEIMLREIKAAARRGRW